MKITLIILVFCLVAWSQSCVTVTKNSGEISEDHHRNHKVFVVQLDASSRRNMVYIKVSDSGFKVSDRNSDWDVAIRRAYFQTNSGTSGTGNTGVRSLGKTSFADVTSCEKVSLKFDEISYTQFPPGPGAFSGNPVLNEWYDYDLRTHSLRSKGNVYQIRNSKQCFKLQILDYKDGVYRFLLASLDEEAKF